jgi:hypothetical protein
MEGEEEEEPKIYINNRTRSWAVVGRVGGVVKVLTKEEPSVESKVIPEWVKEAMKEEEKEEEGVEEGGGEVKKRTVTPVINQQFPSTPASLGRNNFMLENLKRLIGAQ